MTTYEGKLIGKGLKFALVVGRFNELHLDAAARRRARLPAAPRRGRRRHRHRLGAGRLRDPAGRQEARRARQATTPSSAWAR